MKLQILTGIPLEMSVVWTNMEAALNQTTLYDKKKQSCVWYVLIQPPVATLKVPINPLREDAATGMPVISS